MWWPGHVPSGGQFMSKVWRPRSMPVVQVLPSVAHFLLP